MVPILAFTISKVIRCASSCAGMCGAVHEVFVDVEALDGITVERVAERAFAGVGWYTIDGMWWCRRCFAKVVHHASINPDAPLARDVDACIVARGALLAAIVEDRASR